MGYVYIFLSIFFNAAKGYSSKKVSISLTTERQNIIFNTKRMLLSFGFALAVGLLSSPVKDLSPSKTELLICALSGLSMTAFALFWQITIRKNAYMLASAGSSASFIVPVVAGLLFFDEAFTLSAGLSIFLIVLSLFFLLKFDSALSGKTTKRELALVLALVLSQGIMQCMQKVYVLHSPGKSIAVYNFYYFLFAFLFSLLLLPLFRKSPSATEDHPPRRPSRGPLYGHYGRCPLCRFFFSNHAGKNGGRHHSLPPYQRPLPCRRCAYGGLGLSGKTRPQRHHRHSLGALCCGHL